MQQILEQGRIENCKREMDKPAKAVGLPLSAAASLDKIGEYTVVKDHLNRPPEHTALGSMWFTISIFRRGVRQQHVLFALEHTLSNYIKVIWEKLTNAGTMPRCLRQWLKAPVSNGSICINGSTGQFLVPQYLWLYTKKWKVWRIPCTW